MVNLNTILFVCTVIPISLILLILKKESKMVILFLIIGMFICLFSGEVNGLFVNILDYDYAYILVNVTPIVEEVLKLFPLFIFVFLYSPKNQTIYECSIALGLGFALLENIFYLTLTPNLSLAFALLRGCCSGPLHCFCTLIAGYALTFIRLDKKLFVTGCFSLLSTTILFHAIYNLLIQSKYAFFGAIIPILLYFVFYFLVFKNENLNLYLANKSKKKGS